MGSRSVSRFPHGFLNVFDPVTFVRVVCLVQVDIDDEEDRGSSLL